MIPSTWPLTSGEAFGDSMTWKLWQLPQCSYELMLLTIIKARCCLFFGSCPLGCMKIEVYGCQPTSSYMGINWTHHYDKLISNHVPKSYSIFHINKLLFWFKKINGILAGKLRHEYMLFHCRFTLYDNMNISCCCVYVMYEDVYGYCMYGDRNNPLLNKALWLV